MNAICPDIDLTRKPCLYYVKDELHPGFCTRSNHFRCIEYIRRKDPILSFSYLGKYKACKREFRNSWLMGYKAKEPKISAEVSKVFHNYLSFIYSGDKDWLLKAEKKRLQLLKKYEDNNDNPPIELLTVEAAAKAYRIYYKDEIEQLKDTGISEYSKTII
jgi:hypothetical protein